MQTSRAATVSELQGLQMVRADLFRRIAARPHGDARDLLVIQAALRSGKVSLSKPVVALGVGATLGKVLENELGLRWVSHQAEDGSTELALIQGEPGRQTLAHYCFPISSVQKRIEEGSSLDLDGLYRALAELMAPAADAAQEEDWRRWGSTLVEALVPGDDDALLTEWLTGLAVILERLVELCGGQAFLVDREGQIVAAAADPPIDWSQGMPDLALPQVGAGVHVSLVTERLIFLAVARKPMREGAAATALATRAATAVTQRFLELYRGKLPIEVVSDKDLDELLSPP